METIYDTVNNIVINQINKARGQEYFPFMYILFVFILINNLIGLTPYSFASTSHFICHESDWLTYCSLLYQEM